MTFLENVDKAKLQKILLITISALMLAALALLLAIVIMSIEPAGLKEADIDFKDYTLEEKDVKTGNLILADKDHKYSYEFSDEELEAWGAYRDEHCEKTENGKNLNGYYMNDKSAMKLTKEAMAAAHNMLVAAEAAVQKDDILISFTYGYNEADSEEFNTALMFVLANYDGEAIDAEYTKWIDSNAESYGFVKTFEGAAYRYVGVEHAKYITDEKITLADYIAYLKENTNHEKGLQLKGADGETYYVYYVTAKSGEPIKVPAKDSYTISGTNEGGVIVTVKVEK